MKKIFAVIALNLISILAGLNLNAEVYWEFQLGGMGYNAKDYHSASDWHDKEARHKKEVVNAGGGINLFIPVSHTLPLLIETGIHYRFSSYEFVDYYDKTKTYKDKSGNKVKEYTHRDQFMDDLFFHSLQVPLKLNYELRWNEKNSVRFGLGFYGRFFLADNSGDREQYFKIDKFKKVTTYYPNGDVIEKYPYYHYTGDNPESMVPYIAEVGITPSVVYSHRCVSFGISYETPLIYNGHRHGHNRFGNEIMFTFGLKFKSETWKYIGMGIGAAAMVAGGVSSAYLASQGHNSATNNNSGYSNSGSTTKNTGNTGNTASPNDKNNDPAEHQLYLSDKRVYWDYDTQFVKDETGVLPMSQQTKTKARQEMKRIRLKWTGQGKSWVSKSRFDTL